MLETDDELKARLAKEGKSLDDVQMVVDEENKENQPANIELQESAVAKKDGEKPLPLGEIKEESSAKEGGEKGEEAMETQTKEVESTSEEKTEDKTEKGEEKAVEAKAEDADVEKGTTCFVRNIFFRLILHLNLFFLVLRMPFNGVE